MLSILNRNLKTLIIDNPRRMMSKSSQLGAVKQSGMETAYKQESQRMKQFHEKLKLQPIPRVGPRERFVDLVLVETDPKSGELIADTEKDPTKWGDWQISGRVSDF